MTTQIEKNYSQSRTKISDNYLFPVEQYEEEADLTEGQSKSCDTGTQAEILFMGEAAQRGWSVYVPLGHSTQADVILLKSGVAPITVQVKKGVYQKIGGFWKTVMGSCKPTCAANPNDYGKRYRKYQKGEFDILALWIMERNGFALYTLDELVEVGYSTVSWRDNGRLNNWRILE
jgi:hypothetical protein